MKSQFKRLLTLSLCLLCFGISSYGQGIKWAEGLSWEQVKAKAKAENKYIFVDCYATWCGPCKQMDKDVYPLDIVGDPVNDNFISVKIQMDSTKSDTENVKAYYPVARTFEKIYSIAGFPTYLFFSPNGEIVHKATGFQKPAKFIQLIKDAQVVEKQLYTQINDCRKGKMDVNLIPVFVRRLKDLGSKDEALNLAKLYMKSYLETLPESKFVTKQNLDFMFDFETMLRSNDRIYVLSYKESSIIDSIYKNPGTAARIVKNILIYEFVMPAIEDAQKNKNEPDWKKINAKIGEKSNSGQAEQILIESKCFWYSSIKDWEKACDYIILKFQRIDLKQLPNDQAVFQLNDVAWTLFEYSFNKKKLERALIWIDEALALDEKDNTPNAGRIDTKANLLYKLGRQEEAIILQTKAGSLAPNEPALVENLKKMKLGQPTWSIGVKEKKRVK